jgi:hypothetical protein
MFMLVAALLTTAPAPAPAKKAETQEMVTARELQKMLFSQAQWTKTINQMVTQMNTGVGPGASMSEEKEQKLRAVLEEALPYDDMIEWSAEIYGSRFTEGELREMIAFYKTKTGSKLVSVLPEVAGIAALKMGSLLPQRLPALMKKHGLM